MRTPEKANTRHSDMTGFEEKLYRMCPGCGLQVIPDDQGNCPYCSRPLGGTYVRLL